MKLKNRKILIKNYVFSYLNAKLLIMLILFLIPSILFSQQRKIKPGVTIVIIFYGHEEWSRTVILRVEAHIDLHSLKHITIDALWRAAV